MHNIVPPYLKVSNPSKYKNPAGVVLDWKLTPYQVFYRAYSLCYTSLLKLLIRCRASWDFSEMANYDLIILLHSTNADSMLPLTLLQRFFKERKGKLLIFVGNEYCLMPEKIGFIQEVEADFVASQLPERAATWLYGDCSDSKVLLVPHALNEKVYTSRLDNKKRTKDFGFIGDRYSLAIGDIERTKMIEHFAGNDLQPGLVMDIRLGRKLRLPRSEYIKFLNTVRGTIGAESGTYYLEKTDKTQKRVEAFLIRYPKATFQEVYERFFENYSNPINGKAISSRHFEAVGTKTCQILLEGKYNDIFKPDIHYMPLKKDYSNIDDVMERFIDRDFVEKMAKNTYEYVRERHTYRHRVLDVWREVSSQL